MWARKAVFVAAALMLGIGVAGCTAQGTPGATKPPAVAGEAPSSAPSTTTFGSGTSMGYTCDQLLDAQSVSAIDPGLTADASFTPAAGSSAEEAAAIQGTICSWGDASSQTTLVVTAAQPDAATLATLKTTASAGTPMSAFGSDVSAYQSGTELQLFTPDGFWATADSPLLVDAAVASTIGSDLLETLPAG